VRSRTHISADKSECYTAIILPYERAAAAAVVNCRRKIKQVEIRQSVVDDHRNSDETKKNDAYKKFFISNNHRNHV
jgi:hypothetical protein